MHQSCFRGQRSKRCCLVHGVSGLEFRQRFLELVEKTVSQFFDDDESLCRHTALARVVHFSPDGPLDRLVKVGVLEHDEGIAAAQLHRGLLEVLPRSGGDASCRFHATGQRHTLDARIIDHAVHLIVRDQQVGIGACGRACLQPQLLKGDGALRNAARVLHHRHIARHQVGRGKARELIVGKIPGLDAEEHAERGAFHHCFARARLEVPGGEETLGVLGVVVDDVRAERHFAAGLFDELAHLERHRASELIHIRAHDCSGFCHHHRAFREGRVPPGLETRRSSLNRRLKLLVGEFFERL